MQRYKVEPYVVAADVYSVAPHVGRGGWTWYTGSAAWMYRAGVEGILGIRREGAFLVLDPCIPPSWPGFEATVKVASTLYEIRIHSLTDRSDHISEAILDGLNIETANNRVSVPFDGGNHRLSLNLA